MGETPWRRAWHPLQCSYLESPWAEEPGGLESMGSQRVGHNQAIERACTHTQSHTRTPLTLTHTQAHTHAPSHTLTLSHTHTLAIHPRSKNLPSAGLDASPTLLSLSLLSLLTCPLSQPKETEIRQCGQGLPWWSSG